MTHIMIAINHNHPPCRKKMNKCSTGNLQDGNGDVLEFFWIRTMKTQDSDARLREGTLIPQESLTRIEGLPSGHYANKGSG